MSSYENKLLSSDKRCAAVPLGRLSSLRPSEQRAAEHSDHSHWLWMAHRRIPNQDLKRFSTLQTLLAMFRISVISFLMTAFCVLNLSAQEIKPSKIKGQWRLLYKEIEGKAIYSMARRYTTGSNQLKRGIHRDTSAIYTFSIVDKKRSLLIQHEDGFGQLQRTEMDISGAWSIAKDENDWQLTMSDLYYKGSPEQRYTIVRLSDGMLKLEDEFSGATLVFRAYSPRS